MSDRDEWRPDKSAFKDASGKFITQSLFLENGYNTDFAIYTLTDQDKEYKGKIYKSLRKLYLQEMDPTEYDFANKYLWGWEHWQRICNNSLMTADIEAWREELEVKLRAMAVRNVMASSLNGNFAASKWVVGGGWKGLRGRPSKEERQRDKRIKERLTEELEEDSNRVIDLLRKKEERNG